MAMWYRVGSSRLRPVTQLLCTRLSGIPATFPSPAAVNSSKPPPVFAAPNLAFIQLRSFAAPVQAKSKQKPSEDASAGPRVNGAITAPVVRLVTEDGHSVVSLREALARAMGLNLDLVEVQRGANPPVCKIMDFHKEKYKKDIMGKERAKSKSALSLRSGEKKEVRFKAKTEHNDLKVKADGITRLMERGFRVKCTALPSGAGAQEEDLGEHLSRLLALIEDVSFIESGPHVDSKQAYAIVRHVKFETKKSGKKTNKVADNPKASPTTESANEPDEEWECDSESDDVTLANSKTEEISKKPLTGFEKLNKFDHKQALDSVKKEVPKPEMNRYAVRTEPQKNTRPNQPVAPNNYRDYNSRETSFNPGRFTPSNSGRRDAFNQGPTAPNNSRDFNHRDNFSEEPIVQNNLRHNNSRDAFNQGREQFPNRAVQFQSSNQTTRPPVANNPSNNPYFNRDGFNHEQDQFRNRGMQFQPSNQTLRPPSWGTFRKEGSPPVTNNPSNNPNSPQSSESFRMPKNNATDDASTPPRPKFGIFNSSTKSADSSEKDGSSDPGSLRPKFGTFSANRTNAP